MAVTVSNFTMGPATLYTAPVGSTEPASTETALTTVPSAPWVDLGASMGGTTFSVSQTYTNLAADQIVDLPGARLTQRAISLKTTLAEPTLNNLLTSLNGGTLTVGTGTAPNISPSTYAPNTASSATQPNYVALLFDAY